MEAYGTGNILRLSHNRMRNLNVNGLSAFDLRTTKPNGQSWDFRKRSDRKEAYRFVKQHKPDWVIGSPPCTPFSQWNPGIKHRKMDPARRDAAMAEYLQMPEEVPGCIYMYAREAAMAEHLLEEMYIYSHAHIPKTLDARGCSLISFF